MILITFISAFELRASIPFGILYAEMNWLYVASIAFVTNVILGVLLYYFMELIVNIITKIKFVNTLWQRYVERTRKKIHEGMESGL